MYNKIISNYNFTNCSTIPLKFTNRHIPTINVTQYFRLLSQNNEISGLNGYNHSHLICGSMQSVSEDSLHIFIIIIALYVNLYPSKRTRYKMHSVKVG